MKILILGGQGNLGTQLSRVFSEDYELQSWDRDQLDVLDYGFLERQISEYCPDVIINSVAYNAVDRCEEAEGFAAAWKLNVELPEVLARIALSLGAVLIHYSTDYVFSGVIEKQSFAEADIPNPINKYGETKYRGEEALLAGGKRGLRYYLIRTSKLFGPKGGSAQAKPSFFDIMLNLAQDGQELTVVNEEKSCFTYTPDLAAATRRLLEQELPSGIYHITNEGPCTWYEAALSLFELAGMGVKIRPVRSEDLHRAARRPKYSVLANSKLRPLRSWRAALKDYLESLNS